METDELDLNTEGMGFEDEQPEPEAIDPIAKLQRQIVTLQHLAEQINVAAVIDPERLPGLGQLVVREYNIDKSSRSDWEECARRAMAMAQQKKERKSTPWDGASNVKFPQLTTAALQFAARAYPAIVDGNNIVKAVVLGKDENGIKAGKAARVGQHMSYQLLYEVPEWESDVDTMLHQIPIIGCAFKKVYPDPSRESGFSDDLVSAFDLVVNQSARSLETVPRATHVFPLYPHEIQDRMRDGRYVEVDPQLFSEGGEDSDAPTTFLEQHRFWDLDGDGYAEPWIVTVHEKSQTVVRVRANFDSDKITVDQNKGRILKIPRKDYFVLIPFIPDPEGGFYPIGFGKLLEPISDVIDTAINQMMDAGTLQNSGGGFIGSGLQLGKSKISLRPGEYKVVGAAGTEIRNAIVNMEHPGPSAVLFNLLGMMIEAGKDIASIKDILTGEMPREQTATTTLAMVEQGLKVFTAITKRVFRAMKREYKLIYDINAKNMQRGGIDKYFTLLDQPIQVLMDDYDDKLDVAPVADPNLVTDMQRLTQAQFVMEQVEKDNPHVNAFEATRRAFEAARITDIQNILVPPAKGPTPVEKVQMAGAVAEVMDKEASAALKEAQTIKTRIDAGVAMLQPVSEPQQPGAPDENGYVQPAAEPGPSLADIMPGMLPVMTEEMFSDPMGVDGPMPGEMQPPQVMPEQMPPDMGGQMPIEQGMPIQ
jgi:chaperonin GroES